MRRRSVLAAAAACLVPGSAVAGAAVAGTAAADPVVDATGPAVVGPPTVTPDDIRFARDVLRPGTARQVGLLPEPVAALRPIAERYLRPTPDHPTWPAYSGATVLAAHEGVIVSRFAVGDAVRYSAVGPAPGRAGVELPPEERIPARVDTIYDMASISKLFTTVVLLQQVEAGRIDLDAPVARYVPEFAAGGKEQVTVRNLLTHTSGLPSFLPLYATYPTPELRLAAALATPPTAGSAPGQQYVYSDLGLIALGVVAERVTGTGLAAAVAAAVTGPLGMTDTGYTPSPALRPRIAATEYQPALGRGMVHGEVHDENAWGLGGVSGHAGVFSTVDDMAVFCQMLLDGGAYRGRRILAEKTVRAALVNYNAPLEPRYPDSDRGLGFELNKHLYMDAMASPVTFGHTGFTGTSIVIDPLEHSFLIVLSNRVHPDRNWGTNVVARRALARSFADAHPVRPLLGGTAWRADRRDAATVTLTAPLRVAASADALATFLYWYDTEPRYDIASVDVSADSGTTWAPVELTLRAGARRFTAGGSVTGWGGRQWWHVTAPLPAGTTHLRWSYRADTSAQGRGVYTDHVLVVDPRAPGGILFADDGADAGRYVVDGWSRASV